MGLGGEQKSEASVPAYVEQGGQAAVNRAQQIANIPFAPNYGIDVAAISPGEVQAMHNNNATASAYGMGASPNLGLPGGMITDGNVTGYSSGLLYDDAVNELNVRAPGTYSAIMDLFLDPQSGSVASSSLPSTPPNPYQVDPWQLAFGGRR